MTSATNEIWPGELAKHRNAAAEYAMTAAAVGEGRWLKPIADGKWSPAEITEHLRLVYEGSLRELNRGSGMRLRTNWLMQRFLRFAFLKKILKTGQFPKGAKAPSEVKPTVTNTDQTAAIAQFSTLAGEFETLLEKRKGDADCGLSHHLFGKLSPLEGLQLVTTHMRHHHRQLAAGS